MRFVYVLLISCLVLSACNGGEKSNSSSEHDHSAHKPTMDVKLEIAGDQVTVTVTSDMTISPEHYGMARQEGEGHVHMYLDNGAKVGVKDGHQVFTNLAPGEHTLKVSLHNNDHTPYDVTNTYPFEIK